MAHSIRPLWNRHTGRRRTRRRPGSVLILVVALLVLMALIGTAWISTARTDRYATVRHAQITEIDLLVDGAVNMVKAVLSDDLFGPPIVTGGPSMYRPAPMTALTAGSKEYEPYDSGHPDRMAANFTGDSYLADRSPVRLNPTSPIAGASDPVGWAAITAPVVAGPLTAAGQFVFEDITPPPPGQAPKPPYTNRERMLVSSVQIGSRIYPALIDDNPFSAARRGEKYLAADADGDGTADSGLVRMPIGQINGVTYYVAVRIVDNGSGVNVNTAFSSEHDFGGAAGGTRFSGAGDVFRAHTFFPSRVGLLEMLETYTGAGGGGGNRYAGMSNELLKLNHHRWNDPARTTRLPFGVFGAPANSDPVTDDEETRDDFRFMSVGDAIYSMVGSRAFNPGIAGAGPGGSVLRYRAFGLSDAGSLAYGGGVVVDPQTSPTPVEVALDQSVGRLAGLPRQRFEPDQIEGPAGWFQYLDPTNAAFRIRPLLVTTNAVSNAAPWHLMPEAGNPNMLAPAGAPPIGTVPVVTVQSMTPASFNTLPNNVRPQGMTADETLRLHAHAYPSLMPSNQQAGTNSQAVMTKASINTAEFGELWRAFYMVMADRLGNTPAIGLDKMFRSPLRDPNTPTVGGVVTPGRGDPEMGSGSGLPTGHNDVMLLRSALAAVNAIDLRDNDRDVTTQRILLSGGREVLVFGTEPQPYITEVYANTDRNPNLTAGGPPLGVNPKGYVAIELHNPYAVPIPLTGWTAAVVVRRGTVPGPAPTPPATAYPQNLVRPITGFAGFPAGLSILPGERLILENFHDTTDTAPADPDDATERPAAAFPGGAAPAYRAYVPNLHEVIDDTAPLGTAMLGGEFMLLRPRRADGVLTTGNDPLRTTSGTMRPLFAEAVASPDEYVPVDSFDFTGLAQSTLELPGPPVTPPVPYKAIHYVRGNGPGAEWKFVYPGKWDPTHPWEPASIYRQEGTRQALWDPTGATPSPDPTVPVSPTDPWAATRSSTSPVGAALPIALGLADAASSYVNDFPAVQLNNGDWAGPAKVASTAGPNIYPFGAFPRNGDILQVPFFGAYKITRTAGWGPMDVEEMMPATADCARADDNDTYTPPSGGGAPVLNGARDDAYEMLGRFCPIPAGAGPSPTPPLSGNFNAYDWASDLFDYVTVQAPHADFLPNVFPPAYNNLNAAGSVPDGAAGTGAPINPQPMPVLNADGRRLPEVTWGRVATASVAAAGNGTIEALPGMPLLTNDYAGKFIVVLHNDGTTGVGRIRQARPMARTSTGTPMRLVIVSMGSPLFGQVVGSKITPGVTAFKVIGDPAERRLGVEGLVNINTAPRRVLEALPIVVSPTTGRIDPVANTAIVDAIISRRQITPFTSMFDLNQVAASATSTLQNRAGTMDPKTADPGAGYGDYSPPTGADGVTGDFEARFLMMNRLSNLVTTRSDTFTCYVLVQGWQNVGVPGADPELVVQRRRAFIADRTGVTPTNRDVATQNFYNE